MENSQAEELLEKYRSGTCTPEELAIVKSYIIHKGVTPFDLNEMQIDIDELRDRIVKKPVRLKIVKWPLRIVITAAAVVILVGIWTLFFVKTSPTSQFHDDINPGGNKATLTLANGKTINLSEAKSGIIIDSDNVSYNDGTVITLGIDGQSPERVGNNSSNNFNKPIPPQGASLIREEINFEVESFTVSTPKGGEYQITLPDGSKVWLNAASSLTYRTSLNKHGKERIVILKGEAYFEIFKDKRRPFIVKTSLQQVQVLGTHFNVSAYTDESFVKTTLVEGSIKVALLSRSSLTSHPGGEGKEKKTERNGVILKPNQQSVITANRLIKVEEVDASNAMAWKDGEFAFRNEPLESIMRKVARWYNVEVIFENRELANMPFGGSISRFGKVSEVLYMLQQTGKVRFKIDGRRITVN